MSGERGTVLFHQDHPLLGHTVVDTATDRVGILRAVCPEPDSPYAYRGPVPQPGTGRPVAWLMPPGGGTEWTTDPDAVQEAPEMDR